VKSSVHRRLLIVIASFAGIVLPLSAQTTAIRLGGEIPPEEIPSTKEVSHSLLAPRVKMDPGAAGPNTESPGFV